MCATFVSQKLLRSMCYRLKYFDVYTHIYNNKYNNIKYVINIKKNTIETIVLKLFNSVAIIRKYAYFKINYFSILYFSTVLCHRI